MQELGLIFDFKPKPVRLEILLEGCNKLAKLQLTIIHDGEDDQIRVADYVSIATKKVTERL